MQAKDIIARARLILQDAGADYWKPDELPMWFSDARLAAYALRPDLYQTTQVLALDAGTRQQLPDGSRHLLDVLRNVSHAKQHHITRVDAAVLARHRPRWRSDKPKGEILHYLYDPLHGGQFEVWPPALNGTQIEIRYAALPQTITDAASTQALVQEGELAPALVDYVLYRAFQKEADTVPAFHDRAALHLAQFQNALGGAGSG